MSDQAWRVPSDAVFDLGRRRSWAYLTAAVVVLGGLELIVGFFVVDAISSGAVRLILDGLLVLATLAVAVVFATGLSGRITVTGASLDLRLGLLAGATIPLAVIEKAERLAFSSSKPAIGAAVTEPGRATFSQGGDRFVHLTLTEPVNVRFALFTVQAVNEIILATTRPGDLLQALTSRSTPQ